MFYNDIQNYWIFKDPRVNVKILTYKLLVVYRLEEKDLKKYDIQYKTLKRKMQLEIIKSIK